jgi:hypothetical protein
MASLKFAEAQQSCDDNSQQEPAVSRCDATKPTGAKRSFWQKKFKIDLGATKKATALLSLVRGTKGVSSEDVIGMSAVRAVIGMSCDGPSPPMGVVLGVSFGFGFLLGSGSLGVGLVCPM